MKVLDPGHRYELQVLDCNGHCTHVLQFVKREGEGYPGNVGHHPGTIIQEVLRACIDRIKYVNNQIPSPQNDDVLYSLRASILKLEIRACQRHNQTLHFVEVDTIEDEPVGKNGHLLKGAGREVIWRNGN